MRIIIRFKSGFELPITCDSFSLTQHQITDEITEYEINRECRQQADFLSFRGCRVHLPRHDGGKERRMSVLIKGMKMPENCMECPFKGFDRAKGKGNICTIDEEISLHAVLEGLDIKFVKMGDCPLIELPDHGDLIDRDELMKHVVYRPSVQLENDTGLYVDGFNDGYKQAQMDARYGSLTDKEQRIFLAAMSREEKVCEEVDRNYVHEPYEDSLVSVCREIKRKVKGALWMT